MDSRGYEGRFQAIARFFAEHRAVVILDREGPNQIARYEANLPGQRPERLRQPKARPSAPAPRWAIQVQGWVNLVHEVAHILQAGRLEEDSGFEYGRIPLKLDDPRDRGYLYDELCACALSCDFYAEYPQAPESVVAKQGAKQQKFAGGIPAGGETRKLDLETRRELWFAEQVDILPVFYGMEERPRARFVDAIERCLRMHLDELYFAESRAYGLWRRLLELIYDLGREGDRAMSAAEGAGEASGAGENSSQSFGPPPKLAFHQGVANPKRYGPEGTIDCMDRNQRAADFFLGASTVQQLDDMHRGRGLREGSLGEGSILSSAMSLGNFELRSRVLHHWKRYALRRRSPSSDLR